MAICCLFQFIFVHIAFQLCTQAFDKSFKLKLEYAAAAQNGLNF